MESTAAAAGPMAAAVVAADAASRGSAGAARAADLARTFVEIRVAEIAGDSAALDELAGRAAGAAEDRTARIELARAAIEARAKARSAREVAAAEIEIGRRRIALAGRIAGAPADDRAARELVLEAIEDALLRRLTADLTEAALAVGWPSVEMRAAARETLAEVDRWLADARLESARAADAPVETDPAAFRASMLGGFARLLESDLAAAEALESRVGADREANRDDPRARGLRVEAGRLLERAARTELTLPKPLAELFALIRARATDDPALRSRLLATSARATDPTTAFVARATDWRLGDATSPFPEVGSDESESLRILAATAEARARAERGDAARDVARPLERLLALASTTGAGEAGGTASLGRTARLLAARLAPDVRDLAAQPSAPPVLVALGAISGPRCEVPAGCEAPARAAAEDLLAAPWFNVPYATSLLRSRPPRTAEAVTALEWLLVHAPADPQARAAVEIIVEIRRAESTRVAAGEVALDRALALAIRSFPQDPACEAWILERVDLALEPRHGASSPDKARELLGGLPTSTAGVARREARAIEIELASIAPDRPTLRADAEALARRAADAGRGADPTDRATLARLAASEAEALRLAGRHAESLRRAELAIAARAIDRIAAVRGARAWAGAFLAGSDGRRPVPPELGALVVDEPAAREALERPMLALADALERRRCETTPATDGNAGSAGSGAPTTEAAQLVVLAEVLLRAATGASEDGRAADGTVADPVGALAAGEALALGALGGADPSRAERAARDAEGLARDSDQDPRRASWILAEALRAAGTSESREEAFTIFRDLAPLAARERDRFWWRAQLGQLEILADEPGRADDVLARVNQLESMDRSLGERALARRFADVRARAAAELGRVKSQRAPEATRRASGDVDER